MAQQYSPSGEEFPMRTVILYAILVPVIFQLIYFAYRKNKESAVKAKQCQVECTEKGYSGYDFKWGVFSGPKCDCLGEIISY